MNDRPILIVPYMWIGDFVRCHTVVKLLRQQNPNRAIDVLTTPMVAPLVDYMPGIRKGIIVDLPRRALAFAQHRTLAERLKPERYGQALVMPRTWKSALAPYLAGIPLRTGFFGEARFGLLNDLRFGECRLARMVDRCAALALKKDEQHPEEWPLPELNVPGSEIAQWQHRHQIPTNFRPAVALAPGAVGPSKRWPVGYFADLAKRLASEGYSIWVFGGNQEKNIAAEIVRADPSNILDLTGPDLRNAILGLAAARAVVSNDSGLLHIAAALGKTSIGIFGPTSPWHWAPLNPIASIIEARTEIACRPCHKPICRFAHHRCMRDIAADQVAIAIRQAAASIAAT